MKKEFLFDQHGNMVGAIVVTAKNYMLFENKRELKREEYKELLNEFDSIEEINSYHTFCLFNDEIDNSICNKFILYSANINTL